METTLHIHVDIPAQITETAQNNDITCSGMIFILVQWIMRDIINRNRIGKMIGYQSKHKPEKRHIFHIQIRQDMYECWLDPRKMLKMSVSLILA
jgi:hypothetical protein